MSDPKYANPYPAQGYYQGPYQGPPVMAPPQYAAPPPRREPSFLEGWYARTANSSLILCHKLSSVTVSLCAFNSISIK
ncbi:unnamed protein product [Miscanthus lutarioriparius]|uniref:Uncharacterized protein n=1 Tax=Miscanthus lutarioriparius TaxID=422564 RepID=A0A811N4W5_9POAL|nr:unnamed protein product [Miscanthus lutarioriparius]